MPPDSTPAPAAEAARVHFDSWAGAYGRSRLLPSLQKKALAELRAGAGDRVLDVSEGMAELRRLRDAA
jgi:hypothetical protein